MVNHRYFGSAAITCDVTYREVGRVGAPVLVLANSLGTDSRLWNYQVRDWAEDYRVIGFEYQGHGSPAWAGEQTMHAFALRLASLLEAIDVEEYFFCGISMGGAIGMELARLHRNRMRKLVLANTAAEFGTQEFWAKRSELAIGSGMSALADATLARWFTPQFSSACSDVVAFAKTMFIQVDPQGYAACCQAIGKFDFRAQLGQIVQPALVIAGTDDFATTIEQAAVLSDGIPKSTYAELETAHIGNLGAPDAFVRLVSEFLEGA
ncbi:alpha/beta fold hydrolase [Paraburkholderia caribensis]|uniref:alpha/beta fold hydrolase n=1 Tax=Paraburkholderia TaxID=1822464 RepID=UPI001CAFCE8E|nr:alpha/beta fold hydrolase [Paraburkholderia caribensis]BEU25745.1 alpha/beta fold hydrolase [Paraburkholderia sp. 22B1P]CAG9242840.1 Beta-ketoadipate enol-lactone hydrolase [Paraburkholderia caribensis]